MKKLFTLIAAVALVCSFSVQAALIVFEGVDPYKVVNVSVQGGLQGPVLAGLGHLSVDGNSVNAFCVDLWNSAYYSPLQYSVVPVEDAYPHDVAVTLQTLWSIGYSPDMTAQEAAVLQVSIWKTIEGQKITYSGVTGVEAMLNAAQAAHLSEGNLPDLVVYRSSVGQDFVSDVPEPASWGTMAVAGLGGFAFYRRMKRRS